MSETAIVQEQNKVEVVRRGHSESVDLAGIRMEWKVAERQTGNQYCLLEMTVPPGAGVPMHHHAAQETFWVVEGEADFTRIGLSGPEWFPVVGGETVNVPSWAFHGFRNSGNEPIRILLTCATGLESFFRGAGIPVVPGAELPSGPPSPEHIAQIMSEERKIGCVHYEG